MAKNSKKVALYTAISIAILAIVFNVVYFVLYFAMPLPNKEINASAYWVAYGFLMLSLVILAVASTMVFKGRADTKSRVFGAPIIVCAIYSLIIQVVISVVAMLLASYAQFKVWWIVVIVQVIYLGITSFGLLLRTIGRSVIEAVDAKSANESYIKELRIELDVIYKNNTLPEISTNLEKLVEKAKYSDPVSSESVVAIEDELSDRVIELKKAISDNEIEKAKELIKKAMDLLEERKIRSKLSK